MFPETFSELLCRGGLPYPVSLLTAISMVRRDRILAPDSLANSIRPGHSSEVDLTNGKFGVEGFSWDFV